MVPFRIEERITSVAQFERIQIDVTGIGNWRDMVKALGQELERERKPHIGRTSIVRLSVTGETPLAWHVRRDRDLLKTEADNHAASIGSCWVEKLEIDCRVSGIEKETQR